MCDYDGPQFVRHIRRKARKRHKCYECDLPIIRGEIYTEIVGVWDWSWSRYKVCCECREWSRAASDHLGINCYEIGRLAEEIAYHTSHGGKYGPDGWAECEYYVDTASTR